MRWLPDQPVGDGDPETTVREIDYAVRTAVEDDDRVGATGEWVAVLGFSQGAKVAAGLLYRQQVRYEKKSGVGNDDDDELGMKFRFGVLLAGRAPLVSLDPVLASSPALLGAAQASDEFDGWEYLATTESREHILRIPTVHVHGLRDPGLARHRQLLEEYCEKGTARLVEWDGGHRVPIKTLDAEAVVNEILDVAVQTGVLQR